MATAISASQDPWELAKSRFSQDLEPHERDLFNNATLENIYYSAGNANRADAETSKTRGVARRLGPLVSAIESYGGALDTSAQISPQYLSPLWGSIRVLLVVASSYSKFYDKIVDTLGRIGDILPRFRDYERIYDGQKHQRLTQALSNTYLEIITLCSEFRKTIRGQKNSKVRRLLKPLVSDKQFDEAIDRFRQHKQNVEDEARTCHMIEAAEERDAQLVVFAEERRRKLLAKLSNVNSKRRHRKLKDSRHEGTGLWFLFCPEYESWQAASESSVLCCHGIPGCGKSVLASSIIDSWNASGTLIFYYCDYADKRTLEPSIVFGTMARQALEKLEVLPETLASEIEQAEHDGEKLADPSKALIILQKSFRLVPNPIHLILDGLDEATESAQNHICNNLKQLLEKTGLPIKLLITGREDLSSSLMLEPSIDFFRVSMASNAISLDIEKYVRASTRRLILDGSLVIKDPDLEKLIVSELVDGAKGMFLWVRFQLHDLCEPESDYGIQLVLKNLPRSLSETYERLLSKIEGTERKDMIQSMFKWIVCAREPIHLEGMREAVAFTLEDLTYDSRKLPTDLNRLVRACSNLVVVDEESQVIQLAHHTVQQYLLQQNGNPFQFTIKDANIMAGELCVAYLSFTNFENRITRYAENKNTDMLALEKIASHGPMLHLDYPGQKIVRALSTLRSTRPIPFQINMTQYVPPQRTTWQPANFEFLSYIVAHWLWHTISFHFGDDLNNGPVSRRDRLFKNLILSKQLLFDFRPWGEFTRIDHEARSISLLGWGLMANHLYLIRTVFYDIRLPSLWEMWKATCKKYSWAIDASPPVKDSNPQPRAPEPVPYHLNQLDLDYDSSFISESPDLVWLFSRLVWAVKEGHIDAMRELDFKITRDGETTRHDQLDSMIQYLGVIAAAAGNLELLQFLHSKVVTEPLHRFSVVSDLTKGDGWTVIEHAAVLGHLDVVAYLIHQGKLPTFIPVLEHFETLLETAINDNHIKRVECALLLQKDAAITWGLEYVGSDRRLSKLLVKAITNGQTEIVTLLLEHGVDPNGTPESPSPLVEAIRHSKTSIVSILLEYDCFLGNTAFGMPLTLAACLGNFSIAHQLILSGADVFKEEFNPETVMAMVYDDAKDWHQAKAVIRHENGHSMCLSPSPLYMAGYHGHLTIVELLLAYGAAANYLSPSYIIWMKIGDPWPTKTSKIDYSLDHRLNNIDEIQSIGRSSYYPEPVSVELCESGWKLPVVAARTRNHEAITCLLLSFGALWPEEFDSLYNPYLGSSNSQMEKLRSCLRSYSMTGTGFWSLRETEHMRTRMREVEKPRIPASRIRSVGELQIITEGSTEMEQERLSSRISELKDKVQKLNPNCRDLLQASLIQAAESCQNQDDPILQKLLDDGASLTSPDRNGVHVPNPILVLAAKQGNSTLRQAFLDMSFAMIISSLHETENLWAFKKLLQKILSWNDTASLMKIMQPAGCKKIFPGLGHAIDCCYIHRSPFFKDYMGFMKRLYNILLFPSSNCAPLDSALFAAVENGNQDLVKLLCERGANANAKDYNGATPLHCAAERGESHRMFDILLIHGADPTFTDYAGETMLYKAAVCGRYFVERLKRAQYSPSLIELDNALALCVSNRNINAWKEIAQVFSSFEEAKCLLLYNIRRAQYLLATPCQHIEGLFELSAVHGKAKVPTSTAPAVHAGESENLTGLSEATSLILCTREQTEL